MNMNNLESKKNEAQKDFDTLQK